MAVFLVRRLVGHFEEDFAGLLMAGVLLCLGLQVVSRYVFNAPVSWTEEVARHLFVWTVFFGASAVMRSRGHVAFDLLSSLWPRRVRLALECVVSALIFFFLANLFYWGALAAQRMWSIPTATLELPQGLVHLVFPVTAVLMALRLAGRLRRDLREGPVDVAPETAF